MFQSSRFRLCAVIGFFCSSAKAASSFKPRKKLFITTGTIFEDTIKHLVLLFLGPQPPALALSLRPHELFYGPRPKLLFYGPPKPELRFCADSNPVLGVSEIRDGEDLWQWSWLEIRLKAFRRSTIPQKQFIIIIINSSSSASKVTFSRPLVITIVCHVFFNSFKQNSAYSLFENSLQQNVLSYTNQLQCEAIGCFFFIWCKLKVIF